MNAGCAVRLKVGPVIPGAAACAAGVSSSATATISATSSCVFAIFLFMFVVLMAALLVDPDFGHQAAEVLSIVRQVVKVGGVEVEHASRRILRRITGVQNHIQRLTTAQRDRIG